MDEEILELFLRADGYVDYGSDMIRAKAAELFDEHNEKAV